MTEISKMDFISLHPPLSKVRNVSPPFGKGRWGGILQDDFISQW
jgi:hypothetical protein